MDLYTSHFKHLMYDSIRIPTPYCYRCPLDLEMPACDCACTKYLEEALDENAGAVAAVVIEPMLLGAGGMITYPAEYLRRGRQVTSERGVHLILDEVATGFGRTAKMFAADHAGHITRPYVPLQGLDRRNTAACGDSGDRRHIRCVCRPGGKHDDF